MEYWPDRVKEKCKTKKSFTIAHGLEELYEEKASAPKKGRKIEKKTTLRGRNVSLQTLEAVNLSLARVDRGKKIILENYQVTW